MKQSEAARILELLTRLTEAVIGSTPVEPRGGTKPSLSERVDRLDAKVGTLDGRVCEVQLGLATLAADTKAQFKRVDDRFEQMDRRFERVDKRFDAIDLQFKGVGRRFDQVDQKIESARVEIVDLVERVHEEVTGRIVDLETPGTKGHGGGGSGSGGGGVPLAS
jgi:hypothetical protein